MKRLLVIAILLLCVPRVIAENGKEDSIAQSRFIPIQVIYELVPESEIRDPELVQVTKIRVLKIDGHPGFLITILNKTKFPVDIDGDIIFYNKQGREVFVVHSGNEFIGQAQPGISEGVDMPGTFWEVNIGRIVRAKVIIMRVWTDTASRD